MLIVISKSVTKKNIQSDILKNDINKIRWNPKKYLSNLQEGKNMKIKNTYTKKETNRKQITKITDLKLTD